MRLYKESDLNGIYMQIRREAFKKKDKKVSIEFIYKEFEWLKKNCVQRIV